MNKKFLLYSFNQYNKWKYCDHCNTIEDNWWGISQENMVSIELDKVSVDYILYKDIKESYGYDYEIEKVTT